MRRNGFTLIELLVVIAIIAILAAIIFPVYAQAKKSAYKSSDLSNMNTLRTALQLYKADQGAFPPALLGFVGPYSNRSSDGNILPPNAIRDALYPKRVESLAVFRPALNRVADNAPARPYDPAAIENGSDPMVTTALWPGTGFGAAGDNRQRYGLNDGPVQRAAIGPGGGCEVAKNYYYRISGYDAAPVITTSPNGAWETHYQLFWTGWSVPANPCSPAANENGSAVDDPRQLGYTEPPETTVVTWNSFFREYTNGNLQRTKSDLVLFLAGNARPMDSQLVASNSWAVKP
ncbi:prepilin-type N-terminal cleavage/methylation domain-containing protein [bacterium]|nr:MAG: prepilin-type N-terminal cleavage/methylation domain-containing protein [bacterium]